jgi:3-oxoacyl-[acyl-carrier protein] reductase
LTAPLVGPLAGRSAIVTGAGQGVGKGIALALARAGAAVVIATRRAETGDPVASGINDLGGRAVCIQTDVGRRADVEAAVTVAVDHFGGLDIMVHNAFSGQGTAAHRLEDAGEDLWIDFSRTGVWASYFCAQAALPHLRPGRGRLVLVSSPSGIEGSAGIPLYSSVKAAQRALAKSLALEWGPLGITVNCIAPVAETPALAAAFRNRPDLKARVVGRTALGRVGDPEADIGPVVAWLASDAGGYVTGQTIVCDGGGFMGL